MKGYKYLKEGMKAPYYDFTYELDKWFEVENESKLEVCEYGFHFCMYLMDILLKISPYPYKYDIYEIEASGAISCPNVNISAESYCSSKIRIVKKLEDKDILDLIKEEGLLYSDDHRIREGVARRGYHLDVLINDEDERVRAAVAMQKYGLDKLINDESWLVRRTVALNGYGLDILINDEDWLVRVSIAQQGYGLDVLINDENEYVREAVACKDYGLDILANDDSAIVKSTVETIQKQAIKIKTSDNLYFTPKYITASRKRLYDHLKD